MNCNDVIRRVRYALSLNNTAMVEIFRLVGHSVKQSEITSYLRKEGEEGYQECSEQTLCLFLDGLILKKRGAQSATKGDPPGSAIPLSNNAILKKIRVALQLKDGDIMDVLRLAQVKLSKSEVNAFFRAEGHENYKPCGDQVLRNFLKGLTIRYRQEPSQTKNPENGEGQAS
ncbi:DUF1456 family protein [Geomonas sp. RF6]|uniref:DUF1456 family protein n=1 Tax=Geomonas sp. RF6 TaxID=2897342 RepID=UPI001E39EF7A|nr:DUF1456 family protein [Geomonas sp. RF6]UFS69841.1 DUF1456 family protein [Geomonas sp. RF6]